MIRQTVVLAALAILMSGSWSEGQTLTRRNYADPRLGSAVMPEGGEVGRVAAEDLHDQAMAAMAMDPERLRWHLPDPTLVDEVSEQWLADARDRNDDTATAASARAAELVKQVIRPNQVFLTLEEALRRGLINSFEIEVESYTPAIAMAAVISAEAAFDANFFTTVNNNNIDRPSGSQLLATDVEQFSSTYGVTKLLPIGTQVAGYYGLDRTFTSLAFQQINPEYFSRFVLELDQPLLRGFGLDANLSTLRIRRREQSIGDLAFRIQVRDTLADIEELYWALMFARRDVVITARQVAEFEAIYNYLEARRDFDIMPVQLNATEARLEASRFQFLRRITNLRNAQDQLLAAINDPELNLLANVEIVTVDFPDLTKVVMDRAAAVQTALEYNPEILQQKLRLDIARIDVGRAKNAELPRLDLTFRVTFDGLGESADQSFDELTRNNFHEYFVGVEFAVPIGNRGPRAATTTARLGHAQAVSTLKFVFEQVILGVNLAIREMQTAYEQIPSSYRAAEATEREVESIVARAERKDINTLNTELSARINLAEARRAVLRAMIDYNNAIVQTERAKGTLLRYYNVVIPDSQE